MNNVTFLCQYFGQKLRFEKIYLHYWEDSNEDKMTILIDLQTQNYPLINRIRQFNTLMTHLAAYFDFFYVLIAKEV